MPTSGNCLLCTLATKLFCGSNQGIHDSMFNQSTELPANRYINQGIHDSMFNQSTQLPANRYINQGIHRSMINQSTQLPLPANGYINQGIHHSMFTIIQHIYDHTNLSLHQIKHTRVKNERFLIWTRENNVQICSILCLRQSDKRTNRYKRIICRNDLGQCH